MSLRILSASDVASVTSKFSPDELTSLMAQVFFRLSTPNLAEKSESSEIHQPHRTSLPMTNHTALFMPSRISSMGTSVKVVSVPGPTAPLAIKARGLPASTLVLDEESGSVKAVVNARRLTALRNAAGSLLASRLLLPPDASPRTLLAVGAGAQISAHVSLFLASFRSITSCVVFNRSRNARLSSLIVDLRKEHPRVKFEVGILPVTDQALSSEGQHDGDVDLRSAVENADMIVTATSSTTPLFPCAYVKPNTHLCLIGSYTPNMHEIDGELVKRAGKVVVDSREACTSEAGELISAGLGASDLIEIGELVSMQFVESSKPSWTSQSELVEKIRSAGDVTIFKSVGVGAQDVAIAAAVVQRAENEGIGLQVADYDA